MAVLAHLDRIPWEPRAGNKVANCRFFTLGRLNQTGQRPRNLPAKTGGTMRKTPLLAAVILAAAVAGAPQLAAAMGSSNPTPPSDSSSKPSGKTDSKKKKNDKSSSAKEFLDRYHAAYALIYDKDDYQGGITALRAIGYDDNADVATLLG